MTITLDFETMSSNFVCNEAFSEGNQTIGTVTPELPAFGGGSNLEEDDDDKTQNERSEKNLSGRIIESATANFQNQQNMSAPDNLFLHTQNPHPHQQQQFVPNSSSSVFLPDSTQLSNPSQQQHLYSQQSAPTPITSPSSSAYHQNQINLLQTTNLSSSDRRRTNTGNSTLSKNSTQSNSSTIGKGVDIINQPLINQKIIIDPSMQTSLSLSREIETDEYAPLTDNQESILATPTTSPSRMQNRILNYDVTEKIRKN